MQNVEIPVDSELVSTPINRRNRTEMKETKTPVRTPLKRVLKFKDEWRIDNYRFISLLGKGSFS